MLSLVSRRMASNRVAVILAGNGVYDGSEVHEGKVSPIFDFLYFNNIQYRRTLIFVLFWTLNLSLK